MPDECKDCWYNCSVKNFNECPLLINDLLKKQDKRIREFDRQRAGVRISLIAARAAVVKGGEVTEEILTELIDDLEGR